MILYHYGKRPFTDLLRFSPRPDNDHKPGGLWLSNDKDYSWPEFVKHAVKNRWTDWREEDLHGLMFKTPFRIKPTEEGNVLRITTVACINRFVKEYGEPQPKRCRDGYGIHIDWSRVKSSGFKGILISPHQMQLSRRGYIFHWYQFDCASGGFWDTSCLRQVAGSSLSKLSDHTDLLSYYTSPRNAYSL